MPRTIAKNLWKNFALNILNDVNFQGANFDIDLITNEAKYHFQEVGITWFRASSNYNNPIGTQQVRAGLLAYLALGAKVQYGVVGSGIGRDAVQRALYEAFITQEAAWAQSVGVQKLQLQNEFALNNGAGMSTAECYTYQQTLPAIARAAGYTGIITVSESQDYCGTWNSSGLGNYDEFGTDNYGSVTSQYGINDIGHFKSEILASRAAFGSNHFIHEWANDYGPGKDIDLIDPEQYALNMMKRLEFLQEVFTEDDHPCFMHCWRYNGNDSLDLSGAKKDSGEFRLFWWDVTGQRRRTYR